MDRRRHRTWTQRWPGALLRWGAIGAVLVGSIAAGRAWLRPGIDLDDVRVATVEAGRIEASVTATGTLVPRNEETVSAPIAAEVVDIVSRRGADVAAGEVLMRLDTTAAQVIVDSLDEQIALARAEQRSRRLELDDALGDERSALALLEIDLTSHRARAERLGRLAKLGILPADQVEEAALDVRRTEIGLERTRAGIERLEQRRIAELERLELERSMLVKQRAEHVRRLELATVRAPRSGLVTSVAVREGTAVAAGAPLATVAALDAFQVEATVSDFYAPVLTEGQPVRVRSTSGELDGTLVRVLPVPDSGSLTLFVALDDPRAPGLRANLRVEADVVTGAREATLTVRRGPALGGAGTARVLFVEDGEAVRRTVRVGLTNRDRIELLDGAIAGDRIVISEIDRFANRERVPVYGVTP